LIRSVANAAAAAGVTPDRAISGARAEQRAACAAQASESKSSSFDPTGRSAVRTPSIERPVPLKLPRARAAALFNSVADAAAAASVTPDRAISGARAKQRADCAALASEGESSSIDRERSRRSRGGERHTRQGDQRCTCRAASGLRRSSFRERARAASIESVAYAAAVASVTPDRAISGVRAEQRATCTGLRGREQQLQSRAKPTQPRRRASHPTGRSAVHAPSSERTVPL
jgi:hypothetical protein